MNKKNLQQLAGALGVPGRSKLNKAGLIKAINQHAGNNPDEIYSNIYTLRVDVQTERAGDYIFRFAFRYTDVYSCEDALAMAMPIIAGDLPGYGIPNYQKRFRDSGISSSCEVELRDPELGPFPLPFPAPPEAARRQNPISIINVETYGPLKSLFTEKNDSGFET